ncbi:MAG: hypothetical protein ACQKBY_10725, partial [Verrucomicrobiales bacterium]
MPDSPPSPTPAELPESLRQQLGQFQKILWRTKIREALYAALAGLLFSFLLVYLLDRFFPTPALVRLAILIAGTSLSGIFAPWMINKWVFKHRREDQLAKLISRKFPKLGDRLLGIIELQQQNEKAESLSPELRRAAMRYVAEQASKRDLGEALPATTQHKLALGLLAGTALLVAALVFNPNAGFNAFKRWLLPLSDTERYTLTQLDLSHLPSPLRIPYGEAYQLRIPLKENSDHRPDLARARYGAQDWLDSPLADDGAYHFEIPPQQSQNILTLKAGDAVHHLRVEPLIRPELEALVAEVTLPDYLQLPAQTLDIRHGVLTALEGASFVLKGSTTRALAEARLTLAPETAEATENEGPAKTPARKQVELGIDGASFHSPPRLVDATAYEMPVDWTDIHGLRAAGPFSLRLDPVRDQPPAPYTRGLGKQIVMLPEESLDFEAIAEDDFGLKELGLAWKGEFTKPTDAQPAVGEILLKKGGPAQSNLSEAVTFSPKAHGIPPQKLLLTAFTRDY